MLRQIFLDTETTGLSPKQGHRVIEIGCVEMINRQLTGEQFHCYINPQRQIDAGAVKVHGLTAQFLSDKPLFGEVVKEFIQFVDQAELIIHNAPFDIGFLNHELAAQPVNYPMIEDFCEVTDSLALARAKHPGQRNSLDALCKRYEVDNSSRDLHGALLDAQILAQVFLQMSVGQSQLFEESAESVQQQQPSTIKRQLKHNQLKVETAKELELQQHAAYLAKLKKQEGQCIWQEESSMDE